MNKFFSIFLLIIFLSTANSFAQITCDWDLEIKNNYVAKAYLKLFAGKCKTGNIDSENGNINTIKTLSKKTAPGNLLIQECKKHKCDQYQDQQLGSFMCLNQMKSILDKYLDKDLGSGFLKKMKSECSAKDEFAIKDILNNNLFKEFDKVDILKTCRPFRSHSYKIFSSKKDQRGSHEKQCWLQRCVYEVYCPNSPIQDTWTVSYSMSARENVKCNDGRTAIQLALSERAASSKVFSDRELALAKNQKIKFRPKTDTKDIYDDYYRGPKSYQEFNKSYANGTEANYSHIGEKGLQKMLENLQEKMPLIISLKPKSFSHEQKLDKISTFSKLLLGDTHAINKLGNRSKKNQKKLLSWIKKNKTNEPNKDWNDFEKFVKGGKFDLDDQVEKIKELEIRINRMLEASNDQFTLKNEIDSAWEDFNELMNRFEEKKEYFDKQMNKALGPEIRKVKVKVKANKKP